MKKIVLKLDLQDGKDKQKAIKAVSTIKKIDSIAVDMKERKMTVIGDVDPVDVVSKLRKSWMTDILIVGPAVEEKKEEKKEEGKDEKKDEKKEEGKDGKADEKKGDEGKKDGQQKDGKKDEGDKKKESHEQVMFYDFANPYYRPYNPYYKVNYPYNYMMNQNVTPQYYAQSAIVAPNYYAQTPNYDAQTAEENSNTCVIC